MYWKVLMNVEGGVINLEGQDTKKPTIFRKFRDKSSEDWAKSLRTQQEINKYHGNAVGYCVQLHLQTLQLLVVPGEFFLYQSQLPPGSQMDSCFSLQYSSHYHAYCAVTPSPNYELMLSLEALQSCPTFPPSPALEHKQIFYSSRWESEVKLT